MNGVRRDLRFALRALRARPGFTAVAVATLALAIGANVTVFSAVYGVLLRPLPYPEPERLVVLWARRQAEGFPRVSHTGADFRAYQRWARSFAGVAAVGSVR